LRPEAARQLWVLPAALSGPHAQRTRADDEQDAQEHEAGRVIGLPEHGRGAADGGDAERGGEIPAFLTARSSTRPIAARRTPATAKSAGLQTTSSVTSIATNGSDKMNATPRATRAADR
jgi:hypothetical protein